MLVRMWRKGKPCALFLVFHGTATMENSVKVPQKKLKIELSNDPEVALLEICSSLSLSAVLLSADVVPCGQLQSRNR